MPQVVDDLRPHALGFADYDCIGVARHFVGNERGVEAAHHHRYAARAVLTGDLVRARRGVRLDRNGHGVGRLIERNGLHSIVVEGEVDVGRREGGEVGHRERLHLPGADVALAGAMSDGGMDEGEFHAALRNARCQSQL